MVRSSSKSGTRSSHSSQTHRSSQAPQPPQPPQPLQPSQPLNKTSNGGGMFSSIINGFSFGVGSSIANRTVNGLFGSPTIGSHKIETQQNSQNIENLAKSEYIAKPECKTFQEEYLRCIQTSNTYSQSSCDFTFNLFKDCESNYKT